MKQSILLLCTLLASYAAADLIHTADTLHTIETGVIRLHILAHSDSTADQTAKLTVRDALLAHAADWIPADAGFEEGCLALQAHLPEIAQTARDALADAGCKQDVHAAFAETDFPERTYGDLTLPAGRYQALRVELGAAKGQNWWCVMYPALCIPAAAECSGLQQLGDAAYDMTAHPDAYEVRLKCLDFLRALKKRHA